MYVASVPNRKSPPAILLRESYREGDKVKTHTLGNLSHLPERVIDLIRRSLKGETFVSLSTELFKKVQSWHHGHVDAVLRVIKRLALEPLIYSRPCRERDFVIAMVTGRIVEPDNKQNSKLANTRWWETTTLPQLLNLPADASEDDLYKAMDWVLERQDAIETKLAKRHLKEDGLCVKLKRLNSSIATGKLAGKDKIIKRVSKILKAYSVEEHIKVDIGEGVIEVRVEDAKAAAEVSLQTVYQELDKIRLLIEQGKFGGKGTIGMRVGKVLNKYKVGKHFVLQIRDDGFDFQINNEKVAAEASVDGLYVIRTSVSDQKISADDAVRDYKLLTQVERAFLCFKTIDLKVRPIRHRTADRVCAHIFLCMLAYYVEWHMREAWRPLLFADEDQEAKKTRDPVAPAKRSESALQKVHSKTLNDDSKVHSFHTLLKCLSQIVRNVCQIVGGSDSDQNTVEILITPNEKQQRAYELLETITP